MNIHCESGVVCATPDIYVFGTAASVHDTSIKIKRGFRKNANKGCFFSLDML